MSTVTMTAIEQTQENVYDQLIHKKDKAPRDKMLLRYVFGELGDTTDHDNFEGNEGELIN